ncbi:5'-nucleotidase SurE [Thalassoglobus neptunius]|uniref:5'-nucleotidase n=1 Tax=Thalassoglobus neptunius TaxID=1938619 RepID=A0A5C5X6E0_9PLAN|nr:5'/3'-nucleotidase SurE [Thalassoglobus neptunius]TWT57572.1 5'-nucleotidase SurE [Thalassoglobus neptunius]
MKFLISNDDGFDAEGILALKKAASSFGEGTIVAPDQGYSGCGHRVTDKAPIRVESRPDDVHVVYGTPADCTRLGLVKLVKDPDWVLSGINHGGNLAGDIFMSGTAAAAREAAISGKKAIAFSQYIHLELSPPNWERTTLWTRHVLNVLFDKELKPGQFWNVNFPALPEGDVTPEIVFCRHDTSQVDLTYEWSADGAMYRGVYRERGRRPGCDVDVCFSGKISVTRIQLDASAE